MKLDVRGAIAQAPKFNRFISVDELTEFVCQLASDARFQVEVAGRSERGDPIHHVKFGRGATKALFVGWPHPNEPIGGLSIRALLELLARPDSALKGADVEWNIVPCIDPEGARLNEGWVLKPFDVGSFLREGFRQEPMDQVERSFPINHKKLKFESPTKEAQVLQSVLNRVQPDFYFSLHNSRMGGATLYLTSDIGADAYSQLHALLDDFGIPRIRSATPMEAAGANLAEGIWEIFTVRSYYDHLESVSANPELGVHDAGACSWEYLSDIRPNALSFVFELPYLMHPMSTSERDIGGNLRREKLKIDADNKFVLTCILEEWDRLESQFDRSSPFYRKIYNSVIRVRSRIAEGLPSWVSRIEDLLFNPRYSRSMTEADLFAICMRDRYYPLCNCHEFVRLLKTTPHTPEVQAALARVEPLFDEALKCLDDKIDFSAFEMIPHDALAKVQLGGGLIVLNSMLAKQRVIHGASADL